jgi:hypothetical protein
VVASGSRRESARSSSAEIPIDTRISGSAVMGVPVIIASPDSENAQRFMDIATKTALAIAKAVLSKMTLAAARRHQVVAINRSRTGPGAGATG